jgi:AcrR family transcriptional regulator
MSSAEHSVIGEPSSAPARSRAATRRRLLEAGTELFAELGLHGVTSARIAARAGVATGTFYLHFEDKQALFRAIVFAALAELRERARRAAESVPPDPASQVRARLTELVAFAEEKRSLMLVLFGRGHEAGALADEVLDALTPGIEEALRARAKTGQVAPELHPAVAAQAIAAMHTRVIAWWVEDPSRAPRDRLIETLCRMHPAYR